MRDVLINKNNKMEFTKQEKHELYTKCLSDIETGNKCHCCASFWHNMPDEFINQNKLTSCLLIDLCHELFPELYALKTRQGVENDPPVYWFFNSEERIEALKKCIELTKS